MISIHAPREGGDIYNDLYLMPVVLFQSTPPARGATSDGNVHSAAWQFQSTPPARGATLMMIYTGMRIGISIHAPREGGDRTSAAWCLEIDIFQSTPPARGATKIADHIKNP